LCYFCFIFCPVRVILFAIVWALSLGKISFWLLPNLTEDVGFFESFRPLYKYEAYSSTATSESSLQKTEETKDTVVNDDENQTEDLLCEGDDLRTENVVEDIEGENENVDDEEEKVDDDDDDDDDVAEGDDAELDEEEDDDDEGRRSGSSSNDNGYEIVDAKEVESVGAFNEDLVEDVPQMESLEEPVRHRKGKKPPRKDL